MHCANSTKSVSYQLSEENIILYRFHREIGSKQLCQLLEQGGVLPGPALIALHWLEMTTAARSRIFVLLEYVSVPPSGAFEVM